MKTITNQSKPKVFLMVIISNMKAKESKIKIYCLGNILMLSDQNDHKTIGEWKIQLAM